MKKALFSLALLVLLSASAWGQNCTATTPNLALEIPDNGCYNGIWGDVYNRNFNAIDQYLSGNRTASAFLVTTLTVAGLTPNRCVQTGLGGLFTTATAACNLIPSVYGRTGAITAQTGDYSIGQIGGISPSGPSTSNFVTYDNANFGGADGTVVCKKANGDLKTTACSAGAGGTAVLSPAGSQAFVMPSGFSLGINVMEEIAFADGFLGGSTSGGINEAFTTGCRNSGKCRVIVPLAATAACGINIPSTGVLSGHGRLLGDLQCATPGADVIASVGDNATIENLTVEHSVNPTSGGDGIVSAGDRVTIRNVKSKNNDVDFRLGGVTFGGLSGLIGEQANSDCVVFDTALGASGTMQYVMYGDNLFQKCGGWGASMTNTTSTKWTGPRIVGGTHFFANHLGGVKFQNTSTGRIDNVFIQNNVFSQNDGDDIFIDANGHNIAILGNYVEQSGGNVATGVQPLWGYNAASGTAVPTGVGHGIDLTANCDATGTPPMISGNRFFQDSDDAVMSLCPGAEVIGNSFYDPGFAHSSGANNLRAGVAVEASQMQVNSNFFQQGGTHSVVGDRHLELSRQAWHGGQLLWQRVTPMPPSYRKPPSRRTAFGNGWETF
jgi:hypothetical protein